MNPLPACILALVLAAPLAAAPHQTRWDIRRYTWVHLERMERGAEPNAHPSRIAPAALKALLATVTLPEAKGETLFSSEDLARLAGPMAQALALADPDEDLVFMASAGRGKGILDPELTITGRMFAQGGKLHLLIQESRLDYVSRDLAGGYPGRPSCGSRKAAGPTVLLAPGAQSLRQDWLAFPLPAAEGAPLVPAASVSPAPAVPTAAPAPATPSPTAEERLRALKRLRDDNLITEEEFLRKRQEILKEL
jgi:hypothetical protein